MAGNETLSVELSRQRRDSSTLNDTLDRLHAAFNPFYQYESLREELRIVARQRRDLADRVIPIDRRVGVTMMRSRRASFDVDTVTNVEAKTYTVEDDFLPPRGTEDNTYYQAIKAASIAFTPAAALDPNLLAGVGSAAATFAAHDYLQHGKYEAWLDRNRSVISSYKNRLDAYVNPPTRR